MEIVTINKHLDYPARNRGWLLKWKWWITARDNGDTKTCWTSKFRLNCGEEPNYVGNGGSEEVEDGGGRGGRNKKPLNKLGIDIWVGALQFAILLLRTPQYRRAWGQIAYPSVHHAR